MLHTLSVFLFPAQQSVAGRLRVLDPGKREEGGRFHSSEFSQLLPPLFFLFQSYIYTFFFFRASTLFLSPSVFFFLSCQPHWSVPQLCTHFGIIFGQCERGGRQTSKSRMQDSRAHTLACTHGTHTRTASPSQHCYARTQSRLLLNHFCRSAELNDGK